MKQRALVAGVVLSLLAAAPAWGQPIRQFRGHHAPVSAVAFAPDGQSLASASFDHSIKVWDVPRGAVVQTLAGHRDTVLTLAYTADGRRLVSAGTDGQVLVWDAVTGAALHRHRFPCKALCAAFTPDGRHVGTGTGQAVCYLMELPRHIR